MPEADVERARRLCVLAHASALLGLILPFGQLLGPYLVSLLAPAGERRVQVEATEALNFHLNMIVLLAVVIAVFSWLRAGWWWFAIFAPNLYWIGMSLVGASRASRDHAFRYPLVVRVLRSRAGS
jgi:uncharacterized Tic20 family protein